MMTVRESFYKKMVDFRAFSFFKGLSFVDRRHAVRYGMGMWNSHGSNVALIARGSIESPPKSQRIYLQILQVI